MPDIITIVVPWFGPDTAGGAETQARQLARAIHEQGAPVEVWTTTGRDSFAPPDLAHYPAGAGSLDGLPVRRFPITPPRRDPYVPPPVARRRALLAALPRFPDHELRLLASLVSSDALLEAIASEGAGRRFLFIPYPFPTSFWGIVYTLSALGSIALAHGEDQPARAYFQAALSRAIDIQSLTLVGEILIGLAWLLVHEGQPAQAGRLLAVALNLPAAQPHVRERALQLVDELAPHAPLPALTPAQAHEELNGIKEGLLEWVER